MPDSTRGFSNRSIVLATDLSFSREQQYQQASYGAILEFYSAWSRPFTSHQVFENDAVFPQFLDSSLAM